MLNSSIESAVTASTARRPSEKAASAPAETEISALSSRRALKVQEAEAISEVPVHSQGDLDFLGRRERCLCQRCSERAQVGFLALPPVSLPVGPLPQRLRRNRLFTHKSGSKTSEG